MMNDRKGSLGGADGVRAIACLMVIFHHITQRLAITEYPGRVQEAAKFFLLGNSGVSFFFVLSGFLLSFPFWKRYLEGGVYPSLKQYTVRRAARIMPGYYAAFAAASVLGFCFDPDFKYIIPKILTGLTFTSGFHYTTLFPSVIDSPLWSISFEVFCYVLLPVFMALLFHFYGKKRSFTKALLFWFGVEVFILSINGLIHVFLTPDSVDRGWAFGIIGGSKLWMPNYNPVGFFAQFGLGVIAAGLTLRLSKPSKWFDIASALSLSLIVLLLWSMRDQKEFSFSLQGQPYYFPFLTILIASLLVFLSRSRFMGRWLDNPFFRFTAKISFGLYIWHYIILTIINYYWANKYLPWNIRPEDLGVWAIASLSMVAASYAVAALSYYFLEKPFLDRAHQRLSEPKPVYRIRKRVSPAGIVNIVILGIAALIFLFPLIWLFDASMRPPIELLQNPPIMFKKPIWESVLSYTRNSYVESMWFWHSDRALLNSIIITGSTIVLTLVVSSLFAYALVFIKFPVKKLFFNLAAATMMVPMATLCIAYYIVAIHLNLSNNWLGVILPSSVSGLGVFLLRQYFIKIPTAFVENARMDGASHLQVWWYLIIPMSRPALAALAVIQFRIVWNDFLMPAFILNRDNLVTVPILMVFMNGRPGVELATGFLAILLPLLLFLKFHRQFIEGITGGLKE